MHKFVYDLVVLRVDGDSIIRAIKNKVKNEKVRKIYLEAIPFLIGYFSSFHADFAFSLGKWQYKIGKNFDVPFDPKFLYAHSGKIILPWVSYWKSNPLSGERVSLFKTIINEICEQDPALEGTVFNIIDISAPVGKSMRELRVVNGASIPMLSNSRKTELLEIFHEGFEMARSELRNHEAVGIEKKGLPRDGHDGQYDLF